MDKIKKKQSMHAFSKIHFVWISVFVCPILKTKCFKKNQTTTVKKSKSNQKRLRFIIIKKILNICSETQFNANLGFVAFWFRTFKKRDY